MSLELFYEGLNFALKWEGPETNDKDDRGGHTKFGISKSSHHAVDIDKLTLDQAQIFYLKVYWQNNFSCIDNFLALKLFDLCINKGKKSTIRILQAVLNNYFNKKLVIDGDFGKLTVAAVSSISNQQSLYSAFIFEISLSYNTISKRRKNKKYLLGWLNRLYDHPRKKRTRKGLES